MGYWAAQPSALSRPSSLWTTLPPSPLLLGQLKSRHPNVPKVTATKLRARKSPRRWPWISTEEQWAAPHHTCWQARAQNTWLPRSQMRAFLPQSLLPCGSHKSTDVKKHNLSKQPLARMAMSKDQFDVLDYEWKEQEDLMEKNRTFFPRHKGTEQKHPREGGPQKDSLTE